MLNRKAHATSLRIAASLACVAVVWVLVTDFIQYKADLPSSIDELVDTVKNLLFIAVVSYAFYKMMYRQFVHREDMLDSIRELARAHRMSTAVSEAVIRARSRQELFDQVSAVAAAEGGYTMAWVGLAQHDEEKTVRLVAQGGSDRRFEGFVEKARPLWSDTPQGRGPTGTAIRTGRTVIIRAADNDASLAPWQEAVRRAGIASVVSIPLRQGGNTIGALTLYSERTDTFDPTEVALIDRLAATLASALDNMAHAETARSLERALRMISACDRAMIQARGRQDLFDAVCRIAVEEGGYLMSWVGLAQDDAEKTILPAARAGRDEGYVDAVKAVWSDTERGQGPTGAAIRTGEFRLGRFRSDDPSLALWQAEGARRSYAASIALPLRRGTRVIGALTLYTDREDNLDLEEEVLLTKLAAAISYALENLARQENEREQFARLRRLSHAVDNSPASIVITDLKGNIEYVNAKFTAVSGYTAAEALGKNPRVLKSGATPAGEYANLWATISSGREWHGEFQNRNKFGELYWEWASISPIKDEEGKIVSYIAVKEDITHKRLLESQLRQSQKMEAIGTLAGGVAHDFNNILTVIQGHCSLLEMSKLPSDDARESVTEIQTSVERATALTRQLLAFGRRQRLNMATVDLGESAGRMCRMLTRLVPESVALKSIVPPEPLFTKVDSGMIDQVIMNLVLNARDAISGPGEIRVEVATADASARPEDAGAPHGWIVLRVSDSGHGIPRELMARIFEPFFTTKAQGKGSGLGLAVVDGIVRQHKGRTEVSSELGKGTSFTVFLPRDTSAPAPDAGAGAGPVRGGTETILLAEDEESLRRLCARALEALGYRVLVASSGDAAADLWAQQGSKIQLLVTDMVMPGRLTGELLAQRLRAQTPGLRVVYMSGFIPSSDERMAALPKNSAFLQKPFKPEELTRLVRSLLDQA